ncbi:putative 4-coumarate--CoA ligase 3 [Styela clava]
MDKPSPYPDVVIPTEPIARLLLKRVKCYGDREALVDNTRGTSITFMQVYEQTRKCASALRKLGIKKGDVIAIGSSNRVEYAVVMLAAISCNAIPSPCNPLYQKGELIELFKISEPKIFFCESGNADVIKTLTENIPTIKSIFTFDKKEGFTSYADLIKDDGKDYPENEPIDVMKDVALLPYSSGTTGLPKAVMLTHYSLSSLFTILRSQVNLFVGDCFFMVIPMFHIFGFGTVVFTLFMGVKNVFEPRFGLESMLQAFEKHKVTHFTAVPPIMIALTLTPLFEKYDTSSLKQMLCGAAPVAPKLTEDMIKRYNIIVSQLYGLTEFAPISIANPVTYSYSSAGVISPNTIVKIIDVETGKELGPGEDGEIVAKGPQMMKGYMKNPESTNATIRSGWLHTGDIGHFDDAGMLWVVDRLKELIKCKGFQVAPAELEALLLKHPKIADVAVIGIPHPEAGEVPKAFVVKKDPSLTEEEVKNFVAGEVAKFKHLQGGVAFVEKIPKSPSGKILRREIRKQEFGK